MLSNSLIESKVSVVASADMGTIMVASTIATTSLENIAKAAPDGLRWFQLYVYKDRKATEAIVRRVEKAGYKALVVTIDTAVAGNRRNDARNSFALPSHLRSRSVWRPTLSDSKLYTLIGWKTLLMIWQLD